MSNPLGMGGASLALLYCLSHISFPYTAFGLQSFPQPSESSSEASPPLEQTTNSGTQDALTKRPEKNTQDLQIVRISPEGKETGYSDQIVIEFNLPVHRVGGHTPIPDIRLSPALQGQWKWMDEKTLNFRPSAKTPMSAGQTYGVTVPQGIRSLTGGILKSPYTHEFTTRFPRISKVRLWEMTTPVHPVISVSFTESVTTASVSQCLVLRPIASSSSSSPALSEDITLKARLNPTYSKGDDPKPQTAGEFFLLEPTKPLAPETNYELFVKPGIYSEKGKTPSPHQGQEWTFRTPSSRFEVIGFTCKVMNPENPDASPARLFTPKTPQKDTEKCDPQSPIRLVFSGPFLNSYVTPFIHISADSPKDSPQEKLPSLSPELLWGKEADFSRLQFPTYSYEMPKNQKDTPDPPYYFLTWNRVLTAGKQYIVSVNSQKALSEKALLESTSASFPPSETHQPLSPPARSWWAGWYTKIKSAFEGFTHWTKEKMGLSREPSEAIKNAPLSDPPLHTGPEDEWGRTLSTPFSMTLALADRQPNFELIHTSLVLEEGADSDIPLYVNNLTSAQLMYRAFVEGVLQKEQTLSYALSPAKNIQYAIPLGIRQILKGQSGWVWGRIETNPFVNKTPWSQEKSLRSRAFFAQITPFQAALKLGSTNGLIFVTDLATGAPVANADVTIFADSFHTLGEKSQILTQSKTNEQGIAILPGYESLDEKRKFKRWGSPDDEGESVSSSKQPHEPSLLLFVKVSKGEKGAWLPVTQSFRLHTPSFYSSLPYQAHSSVDAWGFVPQGVYRPGNTVDYKIYLRNRTDQGYEAASLSGPYLLEVKDSLGRTIHKEESVVFPQSGSISGSFPLSKNASMGHYEIRLTLSSATEDKQKESSELVLTPVSFVVTDFNPSAFQVKIHTPQSRYQANEELKILTTAQIFSGGPLIHARVNTTVRLENHFFNSPHPRTAGFSFTSQTDEELPREKILLSQEGRLDTKGESQLSLPLSQNHIFIGNLVITSDVEDDRGHTLSHQQEIPYYGGERLVGFKSDSWRFSAKKPSPIHVVVTDPQGVPVGGDVDLEWQEKKTYATRVKGPGNAYQTQITKEWVTLAKERQRILSGELGVYSVTPPQAGSYRLMGKTTDSRGRIHVASFSFDASGPETVVWEQKETGLEMTPDRAEYEIGQTAKITMKNPYPGVHGLVTVERMGILNHFVVPLKESLSVIEIPVTRELAPKAFISVSLLSPRVPGTGQGSPLKLGELDLGKPVFRMGYTHVSVKTNPYPLIVDITPQKTTYKPGESVTIRLKAKLPKSASSKPLLPIDLAVLVIDEGVLSLLPKGLETYHPFQQFEEKGDRHHVETYSLIESLVGRMHFATKGAHPGGDGGIGMAFRHSFKLIGYWNPSVPLNDQGEGSIHFQAPDNLTGWRVIAVATTPSLYMGQGQGQFKVNQSSEIRPLMPTQVSEGDEFEARFSVMNREETPRTFQVVATAQRDLGSREVPPVVHRQSFTLKPMERGIVSFPVIVKEAWHNPNHKTTREGYHSSSLDFHIEVTDEKGNGDAMVHHVPVVLSSVILPEVLTGYSRDVVTLPFEIGSDLLMDTRKHLSILKKNSPLQVFLSGSIGWKILDSCFEAMKEYPYTCWEQRLSKALVLAYSLNDSLHRKKDVLSGNVLMNTTTLNHRKAILETLEDLATFQSPNGGMSYFYASDASSDPFLTAYTGLGLAWLAQENYLLPPLLVREALQNYLLNLLKQDPPFSEDPEGLRVARAVAIEALAFLGVLPREEIHRFLPQWIQMDLFSKASFFIAMLKKGGIETFEALLWPLSSPNTTRPLAGLRLIQDLLSGFNETPHTLSLAQNSSGAPPSLGGQRVHTSPLRHTCRVLEALCLYAQQGNAQREALGNKPMKLARTLVEGRLKDGSFGNTQENSYCVRSLMIYSDLYDSQDPAVVHIHKNGELIEVANVPGANVDIPIQPNEGPVDLRLSLSRGNSFYYSAQLSRAFSKGSLKSSIEGFEVRRELSVYRQGQWIKMDSSTPPLVIGELVRVDLYLISPAERFFVVVNDAVPGGLEALNPLLATTSQEDQKKWNEKPAAGTWWYEMAHWTEFNSGYGSFGLQEVRPESVRFYADWIPAGHYYLGYLARVIAKGTFLSGPLTALEMYHPEVLGRFEATTLTTTGQEK